MTCKICNQQTKQIFTAKMLNKYDITYFHCEHCGFLQTEEPYWLDEAYGETINVSDTGYMQRNINLSQKLTILLALFFDKNGKFLDYAGGYGVFTRIMRDIGFDFYWDDKYTTNLFARGFEFKDGEKIEAVTTFESFEHFVNPTDEIESLLKISKNIIFSTELLPNPIPKPKDWWYILEDLILSNESLKLCDGKTYECKSKEQKEDVFLQIRKIILGFKKENFLNSLKKLLCHYEIDWFNKNKELCMTWKQIIELSKDELCTIAGHTKNHYALNQLSIEEVKSEITEANKMIEEKIGKKIEHFAYPFGSRVEIGQREFDIVKSLGFKTATTTRRGTIYKEHKNYLECLPRVMLTEDFDLNDIGKFRQNMVVTI